MPALVEKSTHFVIRMIQRGCTNRPFYQIVVQRNREPSLKKVKDQLGAYDPMLNIKQEQIVTIDFDKLRYWLVKKGARPTKPVLQLLGLSGYFPIHPTTRLAAHRLHKAAMEKENAENEQKNTDSSLKEQTDSSSS